MQVFKLFNRIVLRNKSSFLIYFAVVLGITLLFVSGGGAGVTEGFQGNSVRLAADNRRCVSGDLMEWFVIITEQRIS